MTDTRTLLERYKPKLVYDSQEAYFADSAAIWTDAPSNVLKRADGTVIAKPPQLSLQFLGPHTYSDGRQVLASDVIGETTKDYAKHAAALHKDSKYANRVYGHARKDGAGRLWLQYWLFYYYNDFQLLGSLFSGGKHEGDWELVQIRLGPSEQPEQIVFSQHRTAESKPWAEVKKAGANTPLVYVARGSHANYFGPGSHFTGTWFDQADGKGPQISPKLEVLDDSTPAWTQWPGAWGDTKSTSSPLDSNSPTSIGRRPHWLDPSKLAGAVPKAAPQPPAPPTVEARRVNGDRLVVTYTAPPEASALVVATCPKGSTQPATTRSFALDSPTGEVEVPAVSDDDDVWTSVVTPDQGASAAVNAG
jgi:hypothetical protein